MGYQMSKESDAATVRALVLAIFETNGQLIDVGNQIVGHLGLTTAWWQVLGALGYSPTPLPVASIARNMGLTRQAVQRVVNRLAERKLVTFAPNPHHQRAKLVVLTDAGQQALKGAELAVLPIDQKVVEQIGLDRLSAAAAVLKEFAQVVEQASQPHANTSELKTKN